MIAVGTGDGPPDLEAGIRLAERYPSMYATVGIHPHDASKPTSGDLDRLRHLARHPKVLLIGEIGLDYHYDFSPPEQQREVFIEQLRLAADLKKPVVIHTREAWTDTVTILKERWSGAGIMHCFTGGPEEARECVNLGFYISFGGVLTFPKASNVRQAATEVPLDRLLVETDAPYLSPVPYRGKRNEPAFVVATAGRLADLRGMTYEDLERVLTENLMTVCVVH